MAKIDDLTYVLCIEICFWYFLVLRIVDVFTLTFVSKNCILFQMNNIDHIKNIWFIEKNNFKQRFI